MMQRLRFVVGIGGGGSSSSSRCVPLHDFSCHYLSSKRAAASSSSSILFRYPVVVVATAAGARRHPHHAAGSRSIGDMSSSSSLLMQRRGVSSSTAAGSAATESSTVSEEVNGRTQNSSSSPSGMKMMRDEEEPIVNGEGINGASSSSSSSSSSQKQQKEALVHVARRITSLASDIQLLQRTMTATESLSKDLGPAIGRMHHRISVMESKTSELMLTFETMSRTMAQMNLRLKRLEQHGPVGGAAASVVAATEELVPTTSSSHDAATATTATSSVTSPPPLPPPPAQLQQQVVTKTEFSLLLSRLDAMSASLSLIQHERSVAAAAAKRKHMYARPPQHFIDIADNESTIDQMEPDGESRGSELSPAKDAAPTTTATKKKKFLTLRAEDDDACGGVRLRAAQVLVKNVPSTMTAAGIKMLFSASGTVMSVVIHNSATGTSASPAAIGGSKPGANTNISVSEDHDHPSHASGGGGGGSSFTRTMRVTFSRVEEANDALVRFQGHLVKSSVGAKKAGTTNSDGGGGGVRLEVEPMALYDLEAEATNCVLLEGEEQEPRSTG